MRFSHFWITEKELTSAMSSVVADTLGHVVDWTSTVDQRQDPYRLGFFVELAGNLNEGMSLFCLSLRIVVRPTCYSPQLYIRRGTHPRCPVANQRKRSLCLGTRITRQTEHPSRQTWDI